MNFFLRHEFSLIAFFAPKALVRFNLIFWNNSELNITFEPPMDDLKIFTKYSYYFKAIT